MNYVTLEDYPYYMIFKNGMIIRNTKQSKNGKTLRIRVITSTKAKNGYRTVRLLNKDGMLKQFYLHRLIWEAFNGERPQGLEVCHEDCNRDNNMLSNLQLLTHTQNCRNPQSIQHYTTANQISKGKFDREKMQAAKSQENKERLKHEYMFMLKETGSVGVYAFMKKAHCNYYTALKVIAEMQDKSEINQ